MVFIIKTLEINGLLRFSLWKHSFTMFSTTKTMFCGGKPLFTKVPDRETLVCHRKTMFPGGFPPENNVFSRFPPMDTEIP